MDYKDEKILSILKENSKLSTQQISKRTMIPITTVHSRIKKLEKEGIIEKYTIEINNKKINKPIAAYILMNIDNDKLNQLKINQHEVAKNLKKLDQVEISDNVTGETDIIIKIRVKDIDELDDFLVKKIGRIEGVNLTRTMIALHEN